MTVHVLHAGDGYTYMTRHVATGDNALRRPQTVADYYTATGNPPGRWMGSGLAELGVSGAVSEPQMKALFGLGLHPDAERLIEEKTARLLAEGATPEAAAKEAIQAARLGRKFAVFEPPKVNLPEMLDTAYREARRTRGRSLSVAERSAVRADTVRSAFRIVHDRTPVDRSEEKAFERKMMSDQRQPVAGYDLVFTPAKSVSVLWALGTADTRRAVDEAHRAAVMKALAFMEKNAAKTRTGRAGIAQIDTQGLVVAAFDHRDSRGGDPGLHTHCAVSTKVLGADGKWRSLDGREVFRFGVAASETYNTAIEDELRARLGVGFVDRVTARGARPVREVDGIDQRLIEVFSSRRSEIERRLTELISQYRAKHGKEPPKPIQLRLAQQATLETRRGKEAPRAFADQQAEWIQTAARTLGIIEEQVTWEIERAVGRGVVELRSRDVDVAAYGQAVVAAVTEHRGQWRESHLRAEAERMLRPVAVDSVGDRERLVSAVTQAAVAASVKIDLPAPERLPAQLERADGQSVFVPHGAPHYTSIGVIDAESRLLDAAQQAVLPVVASALFQASLAAFPGPLDSGQIALAREFVCGERVVGAGIGPAGAGKTTTLRLAVAALRDAGSDMVALAPSAAAAQVLRDELGVGADTVDMFLTRARFGNIEVQAGQVLVIDEAGMTSTAKLDEVVAIAKSVGAHVRLIGDPRQLNAIGAGGALRLVAEEAGAVELYEVHRFLDPGEAAATLKLRDHKPQALDWYEDHDRISAGPRDTQQLDIVTAWRRDLESGAATIMIASTREAVAALSELARDGRIAAGLIDLSRTVALSNGATAGVGDVIVTRMNDRYNQRGDGDYVKNGDIWIVQDITHSGTIMARHVAKGDVVALHRDYVTGHVELGYAATITRAQGMTVDSAHVLVDARMRARELYVAMTRGRLRNQAYVVTDDPADIEVDHKHEPVSWSRRVLEQVLGNETDDDSALLAIRDEQNAAMSLARLVPEMEHGLELYFSDTMTAAVEEVFGQATTADAEEAAVGGAGADGTTGGDEAGPLDPETVARRARLLRIHIDAYAFFRDQVDDSWVPSYLAGRGLGTMVASGEAGYAPAGWTVLLDHLRGLGHSDEELLASGLATTSRAGTLIDRFRDRLMLPIRSADGEIIAFTGRAAEDAGEQIPKYLNSPGTELYVKGDVLMGLAENVAALRAGAIPVIVEGRMDAEAVTASGGGRVVGLSPGGTALTAAQVAALAQVYDVTTGPVVVATDPDTAGQKAAERAWELLREAGASDLRAPRLPAGQDPADLLKDQGPGAVLAAVTTHARPLVDQVVEQRLAKWSSHLDQGNVLAAVDALRDIAPIIAALPADQRAAATASLYLQLDLDVEVIGEEIYSAVDALAAQRAQDEPPQPGEEARPGEPLVALSPQDILEDAAWPALSDRLARIAAAGIDPAQALREAVESRELDTAESVVDVIIWRLDQQHGYDLVPTAPTGTGSTGSGYELAGWLQERAATIEARLADLVEVARAEQPVWLRQVREGHLRDVVAYRDRYGIDGADAIGPEPRPGQQRARWKAVSRYVTEPGDVGDIGNQSDAQRTASQSRPQRRSLVELAREHVEQQQNAARAGQDFEPPDQGLGPEAGPRGPHL
ncbi:MobF family relaxase [Kribbella sp. NPDC050820]|uniref:MobF family relaxase n=1 Tax=Kribbella sp. NPDC050820 TaxID=3155408 RepID=UPI0033D38A2F